MKHGDLLSATYKEHILMAPQRVWQPAAAQA